MWFSQVESLFQLSGITSKQRPFHYVVGALPSTAREEAAEMLVSFRNNPPARPYGNFKAALLERTAASQRTRIQRLLSSEELADRRSSHLSWQMTQLLGTSAQTLGNVVARQHFLQRLPSQVQIVLAPDTAMDLTSLSTLGNRIMEVATPNLSVASARPWSQRSRPLPSRLLSHLHRLNVFVLGWSTSSRQLL